MKNKNLDKVLVGQSTELLSPYREDREILIHQEAIESFYALQKLAKEEIGANLQITSAFRDFDRQLAGWNRKARGEYPLYDDNDEPLPYETMTKEEILYAIMRWSAIPGASRHHWGTDIDVFDANKMVREDVQLLPGESAPGGPFYELHQWLDVKIRNGESLGFFRPYETERNGVGQEKWHLSFSPVSSEYLKYLTLDLLKSTLNEADILLKDELLSNLETIYPRFVTNIDPIPF